VSPSESPTRPWRLAIGGLLAFAAALGIGRFVYTPILPFMAEEIPLSGSAAGFIASANFLGYLLGALAAATPWLKGPRRTWLLACLALSALTTVATGMSDALPALAAIRFLGGAASALVLVFTSATVLERLAAIGEGQLSGVQFAGVGAGIAVSAALVSLLAWAGADWRILWLGSGLVAAACIPFVARAVPPEPESAAGRAVPGPMSISGRLAVLSAAYGLFGFGYVITATFLVAIVRGAPTLRPLEPVIWIALGLAAIPSVSLWSWLGQRIGIFSAYAVACLVEALGVAASVLVPNVAGALIAALFLGGTLTGLTALGLVGARTLSRADPRRVLALVTGAFSLGQIVGPFFGGFLFDRTGSFTLPSLVAAAALVLAAGLSMTLAGR
jgi:predicted MFS family arabinose efflux permease